MSVLRVHIELLRLPAGSTVDRDRVRAGLAQALGGSQPSPHLSPLEDAVVTTVATAVRAAAPGTAATR